MIQILPSIIASSQKELDFRYDKVKSQPILHLDVMDGEFVPNKSLWFKFKLPHHRFRAHLMIKNPLTFIGMHHNEIETFFVHPETIKDIEDFLDFTKRIKTKIYFALSPNVPVSKIKKHLGKIEGVLVMTVNPGKYGAKFLPNMINKIKQLRKIKRKLKIAVDGSVNDKTIKSLAKAGATEFSVGSYLQTTNDINKAINKLRNAI
ncbi:hypothetical protein JXB27_03005 [Candidatus Woesearchaeota archaeon]|nr:hypothetical protein [Candidatus Woesearchaeota archaeon]